MTNGPVPAHHVHTRNGRIAIDSSRASLAEKHHNSAVIRLYFRQDMEQNLQLGHFESKLDIN